jgi:hypothetical protein
MAPNGLRISRAAPIDQKIIAPNSALKSATILLVASGVGWNHRCDATHPATTESAIGGGESMHFLSNGRLGGSFEATFTDRVSLRVPL